MTAVTATAVIRGDDTPLVENGVVVVDGTQVVAVENRVPRDVTRVVDLDDCLLLPGFVDCHVHIGLSSPSALLHGGVTTARDLGWPPEQIFDLARRSSAPSFEGPRIVAAGPMLTTPGGYPSRAAWAPDGTALEVADAAAVAEAVRDIARSGGAIVKVALNAEAGPTLPAPVLQAIVDQARVHGLGVTAHVYGMAELEKALDAGVTELAHMLMSDEELPAAIVDRMIAHDVAVVPTLGIHDGRTATTVAANLGAFRDAGGTVLYGTDLGNEGPRPGVDAREVAALASAGMSSRAIIDAATTTPRARLGLGAAGLEAGAPADLIAVPTAALTDAAALADVRFVMRAGRVVRRDV